MSFEKILTSSHDDQWWNRCSIKSEKGKIITEEGGDFPSLTPQEANEISRIVQKTIDNLNPSNEKELSIITENVVKLNQKLSQLSNKVSRQPFISIATMQAKGSVQKIELEKKWKGVGVTFENDENQLRINFDKSATPDTVIAVIKDLPSKIEDICLQGEGFAKASNAYEEIFRAISNLKNLRKFQVETAIYDLDMAALLSLSNGMMRLPQHILDPAFIAKLADRLFTFIFPSSLEDTETIRMMAECLYNRAAKVRLEEGEVASALNFYLTAAQKAAQGSHVHLVDAIHSTNRLVSIPPVEDPHIESIGFGIYVPDQDTSDLKRGTLHFTERPLKKGSITECEFKVSYSYRNDELGSLLEILGDKEVEESIADFLTSQNICDDFSISKTSEQYWIKNGDTFSPSNVISQKVYRLNFQGLGTAIIGNDPKYPSLYNRVLIQVDSTKRSEEEVAQAFNTIAHLLGMGTFLQSSDEQSKLRYQILVLLNEFFPATAAEIVNSRTFSSLSIEELKGLICSKQPEMKEILERHLGSMPTVEIMPGYKELTIPGLAKSCYDHGARALVQGLGSKDASPATALKIQISLLKAGALSTQTRYATGFISGGESPEADHRANASDVVFTRLITDKHVTSERSLPIRNFQLAGRGQLIFTLNLLDRPSYQYLKDEYGTRVGKVYTARPSKRDCIVQLNKQVAEDPQKVSVANEFMFKHRIPPNYICGMVVHDYRPILRQTLIREGFLTLDGEKLIYSGKPVEMEELANNDEFITKLKTDGLLYESKDKPGVLLIDDESLIGITFEEALKDWKQEAIDQLKSNELVNEDKAGHETVNGIPLDQFLHVSDEFTDAMIRPAYQEFVK
jgi:hypothetical protein